MYRLKYNKVIFLVNISLHEYSSSFVFTQNLKNTLLMLHNDIIWLFQKQDFKEKSKSNIIMRRQGKICRLFNYFL